MDSIHDLICPICTLVLEDPIYTECEHMFCTQCIQLWMGSSATCRCPVCNCTISNDQLKSVPRIARNLLNNLSIRCENQMYGCEAICKIEHLQQHLQRCAFRNDHIVEPSAPLQPSCISLAFNDTTQTPCPSDTSSSDSTNHSSHRSFSCCDCLRFSLISCRNAMKQLLLTLIYFALFLFFTFIFVLGYYHQHNCERYPAIPIIQMLVGVCGNLATFAYILKNHTNKFKDNNCRVVSLFSYIIFIAQMYMAIWMFTSIFTDVTKPDFRNHGCNPFLLWFTFWSLNCFVILSLLYCVLITLKRCCIFLFE
ncbi:E3 ubiquitin-protein ligase NRDP1-like protein [Dinothrombium tinctorium]|uniref:E3 ubiquitin-protein ligase NRDP1-like protein n=1 Tax=Dinothrombium tinctorium TaxID=1965070 RepID=A0A443R9X9_9ACAR|nr:E3 ubiquitin-protein ligase NRDP1-like protein [Dinothrombium tinctorium]